jgi:hypothetical protein
VLPGIQWTCLLGFSPFKVISSEKVVKEGKLMNCMKKTEAMPISWNIPYDLGLLNGINEFLRNVSSLLDHIRRTLPLEGPIKTWIYGASSSGRLTYFVLNNFKQFRFCGFIDKDERYSFSNWFDAGVLNVHEYSVKTLGSLRHEEVDIILCASSPEHYSDMLNALKETHSLAGKPTYLIYDNHIIEKSPPKKLMPILIATAERSGTKWFSNLIQPSLCNIGYRYVPFDQVNKNKFFKRISRGEYTIYHFTWGLELSEYIKSGRLKAVFLYRDLRDLLVSRSFYFCGEYRFDLRWLEGSYRLIKSWEQDSAVLKVKYENLKSDTLSEIKRVCRYLNINISNELIIKSIEYFSFRYLSGGREEGQMDPSHYCRKGITGDWKNYFSEDQKIQFKEKYGKALIELGYENDLNW